jgi:hypothetical protein
MFTLRSLPWLTFVYRIQEWIRLEIVDDDPWDDDSDR